MTNEREGKQTPKIQESDQGLSAGYKGGGEMPLAGYATLLGIYNATFAAMLLAAQKSGRDLPERIGYGDLLLMGVATHKLSRLITKDFVTGPLRAPFTEYKESAGTGEVNEKSRGEGMQRAVGDLLDVPVVYGPVGRRRFGVRLRLQAARRPSHQQHLHGGYGLRLSTTCV